MYMAFFSILETAHGSHFWSVPSQFQIFWSPGRDREDKTDAGTRQHQLLQTPPNIRWAASGKISQSGICGIKKLYIFENIFISVVALEKGSFFQQPPARFPPCQGNPGGKIEAKNPESFAEIGFGHIFLLKTLK